MTKRAQPTQTLASALSTLMAQPAPSIRRELAPAKPGWFWCAFDDGSDFDPCTWAATVGEMLSRQGSGPYLLHIAQDFDGCWFGKLPDGGLVEIGEDLTNRMVRLSFTKTVGMQRSSTGADVRVTWLGEAFAPEMPDEVEPV